MEPDTPRPPHGAMAAGSLSGDDRRHLVGIAARMLGDRAAGEDIVQDALGRLARVAPGEIDDVQGWLAVVVRRLCINQLRSAYSRREVAAGATPPDTLRPGAPPTGDPADSVTLEQQVRTALVLLLDRLTPAERTAFMLHDIFGFPFDDVADIVGRTSTACRQLASRARRALRTGAPALSTDAIPTDPRDVVVERFIAACDGGDITDLLTVLDPDIVGEATLQDLGPVGRLEGAPAVAAKLLEEFGPATGVTLIPLPIEHRAGILAMTADGLKGILRVDTTASGTIDHIHTFACRGWHPAPPRVR